MLARAQRAVKTVLEATVTRRGLLDEMKNDLVLPEQLWDIGQVLQGFTDEAAALKNTLARSIESARDAGRTLALPQ